MSALGDANLPALLLVTTLVAGQPSAWSSWPNEALITDTNNSAPVTMPSVNDVRDGVTYANGDISYTGVLELPVVGTVKVSIQFGANGTEFTGTYAPTRSSGSA